MKVAIYSRAIEYEQQSGVQRLFDELIRQHLQPVIHQPFLEKIGSAFVLPSDVETFRESADLDDSIEFLISLGGDGTLLDTVWLVRDKNIPVLGINFGRLGFLASIGKEALTSAVTALANRTFVVDKRSLIHLDANRPLFGDVPYGLNEFAIHKTDTSPMIKIHTYLNGEFLNTYWADGMIVATPTGSTAYSLSAGGPVLMPTVNAFVVTPVAPHSLTHRPLVVPDSAEIEILLWSEKEVAYLSLDGQPGMDLKDGDRVRCRRSEHQVTLFRTGADFFQVLRTKLKWGER
jgi:NAD+ kinase